MAISNAKFPGITLRTGLSTIGAIETSGMDCMTASGNGAGLNKRMKKNFSLVGILRPVVDSGLDLSVVESSPPVLGCLNRVGRVVKKVIASVLQDIVLPKDGRLA